MSGFGLGLVWFGHSTRIQRIISFHCNIYYLSELFLNLMGDGFLPAIFSVNINILFLPLEKLNKNLVAKLQ